MNWNNNTIINICIISLFVVAILEWVLIMFLSTTNNTQINEINTLNQTIFDMNKTINNQNTIIGYCKANPLGDIYTIAINNRQAEGNCVSASHNLKDYLISNGIEANLVGGWWDTNKNIYKLVEDPESGDNRTDNGTRLLGAGAHEWVKAIIYIEAQTGAIIKQDQIIEGD
jgi:hypothetical protein